VEKEGINVMIVPINAADACNIVLNRLVVAITIFVLECSGEVPTGPLFLTDALYTETSPSAAAYLVKSNVQL
jgi:hypothetical protein